MKYYRTVSLLFALTFSFVGLIFLIIPNEVFKFFNQVSLYTGLPVSPAYNDNFYIILAVGYMYIVTLLSYFMYKYPKDTNFPLLLANAKLASSSISLFIFLTKNYYLIYLTNFIIDGFIGLLVLYFYFKIKYMKA